MQIEQIKKVAVLGLGTMGHGIAQTFATFGYQVSCYDALQAARDSLPARIRRNLDDAVDARIISPESVDPILGRIFVVDNEQGAVDGAQFITEAVREDLPVKQKLFRRIEPMVSPQAIIASNSSTFPISQTAAAMEHPQRSIVTHWFNPPHLVPTVEVVPGRQTSEQTVDICLSLLRRIGKLAVHVRRELPGFLVNRVQIAMLREVWDLYERGYASAEDIDAAICGSIGFRLAAIGPLEVSDFGGLDIHSTVYANLATEIRSDSKVPDMVQKLVDAGHMGHKSGQGFYKYTTEDAQQRRVQRDRRLLALAKVLYGDDR